MALESFLIAGDATIRLDIPPAIPARFTAHGALLLNVQRRQRQFFLL
jgi:hypothetical protein